MQWSCNGVATRGGNVDRVLEKTEYAHHVEDDNKNVVVLNTDSGQIFGLDNSAAVIWNAIVASGSETDAVAALTDRYGISRERAADDVRRFVDTLVTANLLSRDGAS
jgi:hypothetical protein